MNLDEEKDYKSDQSDDTNGYVNGNSKNQTTHNVSNGLIVDANGGDVDCVTLDLGITDLIEELERSIKNGASSLKDFSFSERGTYYSNLVVSGAFLQLLNAVESDLKEHGEGDILARVYWIHARHALGDFPISMIGLALDRVIRQLVEVLSSTESVDDLEVDVRAALSGLKKVVSPVTASLNESPALCASIAEVYEELQKKEAVLNNQSETTSNKSLVAGELDIANVSERSKGNVAAPVKKIIASFYNVFNSVLFHSLSKGILLFFSPLLFYIFWTYDDPNGIASRALSWLGNDIKQVQINLRGDNSDDTWLPPPKVKDLERLLSSQAVFLLPPFTRLQRVEKLQQISYTLETLENKHKLEQQKVVEPPVTATEIPTIVNKEPTVLNKPTVSAGKLEVVDTTGPIEPFIVEPEVEPEKTPSYGGGFPREKYFVTGTRVERNPSERSNKEEPGDYYEIRVPTYIFEHPSLSAYRIVALEVGDEVLGQEVVDRWLKVKSNKGEIGYIPVNDARRAYVH